MLIWLVSHSTEYLCTKAIFYVLVRSDGDRHNTRSPPGCSKLMLVPNGLAELVTASFENLRTVLQHINSDKEVLWVNIMSLKATSCIFNMHCSAPRHPYKHKHRCVSTAMSTREEDLQHVKTKSFWCPRWLFSFSLS